LLLHAQATVAFDGLSEFPEWFDGPERADHQAQK